MNKFYYQKKNLEFFLKKEYIIISYNFKNIKNFTLSFLKKKFKIKFFLCNKIILNNLTNEKYNYSLNLLITKYNEKNIINILLEIDTLLCIKPIFFLMKNIFFKNFCIEISKLSKNNLILKIISFLKLKIKKLILLLKKYEKHFNK